MRAITAFTLLLVLAMPASAQEPRNIQRLTLDPETVNASTAWFPAGSRPADYEMGAAVTEGMTRPAGFRIQAKPDAAGNGFGTLMRWSPGAPWRGKRVQLSARMKSEDVVTLQLWLRVDGSKAPSLAFYNMGDRPVVGTSDWQRYAVVLDVPEGAQRLALGFFVSGGQGVAWAEDFRVEEVGREVPVSVMRSQRITQPPRQVDDRWDYWYRWDR